MKSFISFLSGALFFLSFWVGVGILNNVELIKNLPNANFLVLILIIPFIFPIIGAILIQKVSSNQAIALLDKQVNNSTKFEDFNIENSIIGSDSILTIEQKRKWLNAYYKKLYMIGFGIFFWSHNSIFDACRVNLRVFICCYQIQEVRTN
ncbi:MAG: hypothetical protein WCK98_06240 [bacterium]